MRQVILQADHGQGQAIMELAQQHEAINISSSEVREPDGHMRDEITLYLSNRSVEGMLHDLSSLATPVGVTLIPHEVISLVQLDEHLPERALSVENRSPLEVLLHALQGIGSWTSFVSYSVAGAIVAWIGFLTNSVFLLIAAMLIAPFAGPAMTVAVATATGDVLLLRRSIVRYVAGLALTVATAAVLTIIAGLETATNLMLDISYVSAVAMLLPLVVGAAGALELVASERSSLVPGAAAAGTLLAAALAPPAVVVGAGLAIGRWPMVLRNAFILLLQLVGINLAGSIVLRIHGMSADLVGYGRGNQTVSRIVLAVTFFAAAGLLSLQLSQATDLKRSSLAETLADDIRTAIGASPLVELAEVDAHFTRPSIQGQDVLLGTAYVRRKPGIQIQPEVIEEIMRREIETEIAERKLDIIPLIQVHVFAGPDAPP